MTASRRPVQTTAALVAAALLLAGAAGLDHVRGRLMPIAQPDEQPAYIPSGAALGRLSVGYRAVAADVYWIRAIQYYGRERLRVGGRDGFGGAAASPSNGFAQLYPLLEAVTTLDPRFSIVYRFGAIFLSEPYPEGAGRPDLAVALLEKGLREQPDKWEYMLDIGYVHYWHRRDYQAAASWFERGSRAPGAPWWLKSLAAVTLARGGDRQSSRAIWEGVLESAEIPFLRQQAERSLMQLQALDEIDALQRLVEQAARRAGRPPSGWASLLDARLLPAVPRDPAGAPYEIDSTGRVTLSPDSVLNPLPEGSAPPAAPIP
jgi:hypothetical protein